jgi:hypothetical protein
MAAALLRGTRWVGVVVAAALAAACTTPPPGGGGPTTTTTEPTTTSVTTSTTSTTTTTPTSTTSTSLPDPETATGYSVTIAGGHGDLEFHPGNSVVGMSHSDNATHYELRVSIEDRVGDNSMTFTFATRKGQHEDFEVGYYGWAQGWPFNDEGRPAIHLSPLGFCSSQFGDFEIRDIRREGTRITAIWITFQRYCGDAYAWSGTPAFGEIRIGYPVEEQQVTPQVVRWPGEKPPGFASYDVPVHVRPPAGSDGEIGVAVVGGHAGDFPIRENGCGGAVGPEGCVVHVGFEPRAAGPRHASLQVTTPAGTSEVALDATGALGRTEWVLDIDYEDPSRPDEHVVSPYTGTVGEPYELRSSAVDDEGLVWSLQVYNSPPAPFVAGQEYVWAPYDASGLRLSLSHGNAACEVDRGTVRIDDVGFRGPDERVAWLDLHMDVHCNAAYGHTVRGWIRYQDRDDVTPPPPVTGASASRDGDRVTLDWTNPGVGDPAGVILRAYLGDVAAGVPTTGRFVYDGDADTTTFTAPAGPLTVSIWTYDDTGNVGDPTTVQVAP